MLDNKGFSSYLVVLAVVLVGLGFYLGSKTYNPLVSNSQSVEAPLSSTSAQLENNREAGPSGSVNKLTTKEDAQKPYTSSSDQNNIYFNGNFNIGDFDKTKWNLTVPKKGGVVKGSVSGACTAQINGNMDTPDSDGDAKFTGKLEGKCTPVPRFSFTTDVLINLEGMVHLNDGKVAVVYISEKPYSSRGYFELFFNK